MVGGARFRRIRTVILWVAGLVMAGAATVLTGAPPAGAAGAHGAAAAQGAAGSVAGSAAPAQAATGSDASCPPADPAAAGAASLSAPVDAHAIPGESSATVLWCPPASGAANVTSYTVTASNGQTVTAQVPNDWAIVDGLTNGTSYTFTVTADTGSTTSPGAVTKAVTPEPIAPPRDVLLGARQSVSYDQRSEE